MSYNGLSIFIPNKKEPFFPVGPSKYSGPITTRTVTNINATGNTGTTNVVNVVNRPYLVGNYQEIAYTSLVASTGNDSRLSFTGTSNIGAPSYPNYYYLTQTLNGAVTFTLTGVTVPAGLIELEYFVMLTRGGGIQITEYSANGGTTWTPIRTVDLYAFEATATYKKFKDYFYNPTESSSFRIRFRNDGKHASSTGYNVGPVQFLSVYSIS